MRALFAFFFFATSVQAETCPAVADHTERLDELHADLRSAKAADQAQVLSGELWQLWLDAPDGRAQLLLDSGLRKMAVFDYSGSWDVLSELVAYCPEYAEGYNQRAFSSFLAKDFDAALVDLDRAIELNPRHIGALSGKALTLMKMGRDGEAQNVLRAAVQLNPWLSERRLLKGTDI